MSLTCIEWPGAKNKKGYGQIRINGRLWIAHRYAFFKATGIHPGRKQVCHTCDNPPCVNPSHLWLGTNYENSIDMLKKGRFYNQKKTKCPRGHKYDMIIPTVSGLKIERRCRRCAVEATRRFRARNVS